MRKSVVISVVFCVVAIMMGHSVAFGEDKKPPIDFEKKQATFRLPAIKEEFKKAENTKITEGWEKRINVDRSMREIGDCKTEPCKVFQSGISLAEVTYLILKEKEKKESENLLTRTEKILRDIKSPPEVIELLNEIRAKMKDISEKDLSQKLDEVMVKVAEMRISQDQQQVSKGMLIFASGFCRALYLGASTVAKKDKPTPEELGMFAGRDGIVSYLIRFFTGGEIKETLDEKNVVNLKVIDDFKNAPEVKKLVDALKTIEPLVKEKKEISKQDVENIVKALESQFRDQV